MGVEKLCSDTGLDKISDSEIISMVIKGTLSRNHHFEFFKTKRGINLFKKARIIKGFLQDLKNGASIVSQTHDSDCFLITIENVVEKYKRTVFMDEIMYSVFRLIK